MQVVAVCLVPAGALLGPAAAVAADASQGGTRGIRTLAADARGATFEVVPEGVRFDSVVVNDVVYSRVTVRGGFTADAAGKPSLPALLVPFAVPDGMSPRLKIVAEEWASRTGPAPAPVASQRYVGEDPTAAPQSEFRHEPDPAVYRGTAPYPAEVAALAGGAALGETWTDAIRLRPVRWDPRSGGYRVLRRMALRIDFVRATDPEIASRPALRPEAEAPAWRRLRESTVENADAARAFPRRPSPAPRLPRAPRLVGQGNPEFKLQVATTGWTSVGFSALAAAGFPPGVAVANVGIWERGWDAAGDSATAATIPAVARDANANGVFDAGDAIAFYARNLRDRIGAASIENRFSYANVYWLSWTASPAAVPDTVAGVIPAPSPEQPASFQDTVHLEQNNFMLASPSNVAGAPPESVESVFWTMGAEPDQFDTPLPLPDADVAQPFRIRARYQGRNGSTHRLSIFYESGTGATDTLAFLDAFFNQDVYLLDTGFTIPGTHITAGTNRYRHAGQRTAGGPTLPGSFAWLDWIEATYWRTYRARGNALTFSSGTAAGVAELRVTGFSAPGIAVYDITNPVAPRRVTGVVESPSGGGGYEIAFRTDASGGARRFTASVPGAEAALPASAILADSPSALTAPAAFPAGSDARSILIAPKAFLVPATRLADYRRSQGYVVEVADAEDVYDEFNGGVKSPTALRRYLEYAYAHWTPRPTFVLLAGDATLDYRHDLASSGADWVPTYTEFETISGPQGAELVGADPYYSLNLPNAGGGVSQWIPSVFLGRVPAGSAAELDAYVDKVIQYEQFQPTDTWRGRQLLVSDDEYSTSIFFNLNYCLQPVEGMFQQTNEAFADTAAARGPGSDLSSVLFNVKAYSDPVTQGAACASLLSVRNAFAAPGNCYDQLINQMNQGGLILNVEAHANRYLIAHEEIFCGSPLYCSSPVTTDRINNLGRPFFLMIWGCHAAQFPDGPLIGSGSVDSTDAIGEQWLLRPNAGSVISVGSTAYELLNTNSVFNAFIAEAFHTKPPAPVPNPGDPRRARWIAGEIMAKAMIANAGTGSFLQQVMNRTVHMLGDPMLHMDALPPRVFAVTVDGAVVQDGAALATDSATDSLALVASVRDETALRSTELAERRLPSGTIVAFDPASYAVAVADTGRANTLTARVRPRASNYDLLVRSTDTNGREGLFALAVRTTVRYTANGRDILAGEFVDPSAVLRAEVTTPVPVAADSLELWLDGVPIVATKTATDATNRRWTLQGMPENRGPGTHELRIAIGGRMEEFDAATFQVDTAFRLIHAVVVSPTFQTTGCDGHIFQYELTAPASRVRLQVNTVSGRRVTSLEWSGATGINVQCWDGRDSEGNRTARGVYLYRLTATDASGRTVSESGRFIRTQ
jgi:hypothetical protein